ncbi:MAG: recombinase family protein [Myxococcales bacterium]|nr:recombinase family protein [Myxococcales bacterium]
MKGGKLQRVGIYHRCSTLDQDASLAREELRAAAKARGLELVLEIEETGSGARNDRPGLQQVMEAARRHKVDVVLVWKLDRWGRSSLDLLSNINILEACGVRFIAITQGIDIKPDGDPMSRLILTVMAGVAEFERSLIIERTRLGLDKARKRGKQLGRRLNRNAPDPKQVATLRDAGLSWSKVAAELGCTASAARRAWGRLSKRESGISASTTEKGGP